MNTRFLKYVDKDLKNIKILFFYLKRLIKYYLPKLHDYFENE